MKFNLGAVIDKTGNWNNVPIGGDGGQKYTLDVAGWFGACFSNGVFPIVG